MTYAFDLALRKNPSNCCINRCLLRSYATSRTTPPKTLHKSASKPVISSFYRGFTPLHLNGRLNAQVESDIVGYTTVTMEAGKWYQVGSPFVALEEGTTLKLNDVFTTGFGAGDTLQLYSSVNSSYTTYRWNTYKNGWATNTSPVATLADVTLPVGQAVFINKKVDGDVILTGKVSAEEAVTFGNEAGSAWDQFVCVYQIGRAHV